MTRHISGMSFDVDMQGTTIHVETISLSITDNTQVSKTRGIPDGYTDGDVEGEGELELDSVNILKIQDKARSAGSWRGIEPQDFLFYANTGDSEMKVEAFGCKLSLADILNIDTTSADKTKYKIKYIVTSPDFVHINGIPYLSEEDTRDLIG
ncbi:DUF2597 family protein [Buttiauxella sp. 3AFRM03]|uniref:phage protein n=1 Tax=Buttiauxella sp. 3AFRM03 TaxID=2479367 RepID=UPI000EF75EF6|nr:phage protein [Buttiauxella sp. 3AFRM03]AYN26545.1 DUF2597 family protein [Buttiauxella sp. 3AFRM03]